MDEKEKTIIQNIMKTYQIPSYIYLNGKKNAISTLEYIYEKTNQYQYFLNEQFNYAQCALEIRRTLLYRDANHHLGKKIQKEIKGHGSYILLCRKPEKLWKWFGEKTRWKFGYTFYGRWVHAYYMKERKKGRN